MPTQPAQFTSAQLTWFDAHLDLGYLAVNGRDMLAPASEATKPHPPASCTLPSLVHGGVRMALGTIFTEVAGTGPEGYPAGDFDRAFAVGRAQLEAYLTWRDQGHIALDLREALKGLSGLEEIRGGMGVAESRPLSTSARLARLPKHAAPLRIGILMENADPIRGVSDVAYWVERGLVAVGLSWGRSSRYAGGNMSDDPLTPAGVELVREFDRLKVRHDVSHLSDRAFTGLLDTTDRPIFASHSNSRSITDPTGKNQRHLTDEHIRHIARRGGVVGVNLVSPFLAPGIGENTRASIADIVRHVEHIAEIAQGVSPLGSGRLHVALGSDLDGGFPATKLPQGIDLPKDYGKIAEALSARGWSDDHLADFACGNWLRMFCGD